MPEVFVIKWTILDSNNKTRERSVKKWINQTFTNRNLETQINLHFINIIIKISFKGKRRIKKDNHTRIPRTEISNLTKVNELQIRNKTFKEKNIVVDRCRDTKRSIILKLIESINEPNLKH